MQRSLSILLAAVLVVLQLLPPAALANGVLLCIGDDGHIALEARHVAPRCAALCGGAAKHAAAASQIALAAVEHEVVGDEGRSEIRIDSHDCADFPLPACEFELVARREGASHSLKPIAASMAMVMIGLVGRRGEAGRFDRLVAPDQDPFHARCVAARAMLTSIMLRL